MVDATGVPMFGRTPFMDKNSAVYAPPAISFGYYTGAIDCNGLQTFSKGNISGTGPPSFGALVGNDSGYTFNDDSFGGNVNSVQQLRGRPYDYLALGMGTGSLIAGRNPTHVHGNQLGNQYFIQANDHFVFKNTVVARTETAGSLEAANPWLPCATYTPSLWPDYQPCTLSGEIDDFEVDQIIGKTKVSEYMKYLANVRSLPIGVSGNITGANYCGTTAALSAATSPNVNAANCNFTEYRVSMPFLSGIYGILADKMFPDLLIGANNIRIEFKLASNNKAFWLTMDPCRRIPGTVRDFAPFGGGANGFKRLNEISDSNFGNAPVPTTYDSGSGIYSYNPAGASLGCGFAMVTSLNSTSPASNAYYSGAVPVGIAAGTSDQIITGSQMYNSSSAMGEDLVGTQLPGFESGGLEVLLGTVTGSIPSGGTGTLTVTATTLVIAIGMQLQLGVDYWPITAQISSSVPGGALGGAGVYETLYTQGTQSGVFNVYGNDNCIFPTSNGALNGFHLSPFSALPKPQYVPTSQPWVQKSVGAVASYCNERASCYGTYLPASVPQTRRCQVSSRLGINDPTFAQSGTTAFAIRDLQYIGEQVQLDDISTSAIIQHAATSEIVVWTRGYRSFEANCDSSSQQNIILPIQIGQATALYLVFRPAVQLTSPDYYSNSFSCPFTGLSFSSVTNSLTDIAPIGGPLVLGKANLPPDVGGVYTVSSTLDTQNMGLFSYQLFSGTKQYPLQPIQTVSEMLVEREKSTHSLHNWSWCGTENMAITAWDSAQSSATTTGLNFDPFLDLGFFTTFVPVAALDDQTITQNPYFSIAEVNDLGVAQSSGRLRGIRQSPRSTASVGVGTTSFVGVLNTFVPPIGTFFLGWDFESWTNHDDIMRTGKFLGQEQLSIRMTGCQLMTATSTIPNSGQIVGQNVGCTAIVPHIVKLSFVPGGHMLSYY